MINIYTNKSSKQKDAISFAIYCIQNNIEMDKLSHKELCRLKNEYDETHFVRNGWHPNEGDK